METPNKLKRDLEQFTGTFAYHKLSFLPIYATDGVTYFCTRAKAMWLFDDMSFIALTNKQEEFIVTFISVKDNECDITYTDGNNNLIHKQHYPYTDLPAGDWKFYISNNPEQRVIMLPSEY